jgi:rubrerythrin
MTLRKRKIREFIEDEKTGAKEYADMAKWTKNEKFKKMYKEMAKDELKHLKMLKKILAQDPCEDQNIMRRGRRRNLWVLGGLRRYRRW